MIILVTQIPFQLGKLTLKIHFKLRIGTKIERFNTKLNLILLD